VKIGIFVTAAFCKRGKLDAISGHVQIPLMAARVLSDGGYEVTLVTTKPRGADLLPDSKPKTIQVCVVEHATRDWPEQGVYLGKALRQTYQLLVLFKKRHFDVLHFFGGRNLALLICFLRFLGINQPVFFTPIKSPGTDLSGLEGRILRVACRRINKIIAMTDYTHTGWSSLCDRQKVTVLQPGVMKQMPRTPVNGFRNSVLFWRNAGYANGVDIAIRSFKELAPKYPNIRFVFAVRPYDVLESQLLELERRVPNVDVHIYPYRTGISLASLLQRALFVVEPFRLLSINPSMAILETLYAGVPVIATNVESNGEVIHDGQNGLLIPPDDELALTCAIERLLEDEKLLSRLRENAYSRTVERWNWSAFGKGLLGIYGHTNIG